MYDLVDRPPGALAEGSRFLLWAMRNWALLSNMQRCQTAALSPAFGKMGLLDILDDFDGVMGALRRHGRYALTLGSPDQRITATEAVLLVLWGDVAGRRHDRTRPLLALLVQDRAVGPTQAGLQRIALFMSKLDLAPTGLKTPSAVKSNPDVRE